MIYQIYYVSRLTEHRINCSSLAQFFPCIRFCSENKGVKPLLQSLIILFNISSYRCQVQYTKSYYTFDIMCVSNHDEYNLNCALDNVLESCEVRVILRNHEPLQTLAINHKCVFYSFLCIVILQHKQGNFLCHIFVEMVEM